MTELTITSLKRMEYLKSEIERHNKLYHGDDAPEISDYEYDNLVSEYRKLQSEIDGDTLPIGYNVDKSPFGKVSHQIRMLSLDNCFTQEDLSNFIKRILELANTDYSEFIQLTAEDKIDGLACSLWYEKGKFVRASTRGDSYIGEDVTENVKYISDIPVTLKRKVPDIFEIRGEAYMSKEDFIKINEKRLEEGKKLFATARNAAAGSLRQKDPLETKNRNLKFLAHGWGVASFLPVQTQLGMMNFIKSCGVPVSDLLLSISSLDEMIDYCKNIENKRSEIEYDIDGVVFKINSITLQNKLGDGTASPRWATAYKFTADTATTTLKEIIIQVGRTGKLTPIGKLYPVQIGGVTVSNVALYNKDEIKRLDLRPGDTVIIKRAGDVIPKIVENITRNDSRSFFNFPTHCPICHTELVSEEDGVELRCPAEFTCPAQTIEKLKYFVSRECLNIEGLGEKTIEEFYNKKLIKTFGDIFRLHLIEDKLLSLEGWDKVSVSNLLISIEKRRNPESDRLLTAMGIRHVGSETSRILLNEFGSLQELERSIQSAIQGDSFSVSRLESLKGIGPTTLNSLYKFFMYENTSDLWKDLLEELDPNPFEYNNPITVVFSGSFEKMSRKEIESNSRSLGYHVSNSISSKTDFLIVGNNPGSKVDNAIKLGVKVLKESEWLELISK